LRRKFLPAEHRWSPNCIVDGPLILVALDVSPVLAVALHGLVDQLPRRM